MQTVGIISMVILAICVFTLLGLFIYCGRHTFEWLYKNTRYFSWHTASNFTVFCIMGQIASIAAVVYGIVKKDSKIIMIGAGAEVILLLVSILILRNIAKKKPPNGMVKTVMYMIGSSFGMGWCGFKKVLFKAADVAAELEKLRVERHGLLERELANRNIDYKKIAHNGLSYTDRAGREHRVEFTNNDTITYMED